MCVDKDILLELCGAWENGVWRWNLVWLRSLFEWEKTQICQLLEKVHGMSLVSGIDDKWSWKCGASIEFLVNSAYGLLREEIHGVLSSYSNFFWNIKALSAVKVMAWRVLEKKIATKVILARHALQEKLELHTVKIRM